MIPMPASRQGFLATLLLAMFVDGYALGRPGNFSFLGPMVHVNFGGGESRFSFALEGSYWLDQERTRLPLGFDAALEWEYPGRFRIYSEVQSGLFVAGLGVGPVLEADRKGFDAGVQGTFWGNYYLGADFRSRTMLRGPDRKALGAYFKAHAPGSREVCMPC